MRITFVNLHLNVFFVMPLDQLIRKAKLKTFKHKFLLDYLLGQKYDVYNYITEFGFTYFKNRLPEIFRKFVSFSESSYVLNRNELKGVKLLKSLDILTPEDIIIVHYYYPDQMSAMSSVKAKKIVLGNHFIKLSYDRDFEKQGIDYFVNEIDLSNNIFINKYFNLKNVALLILPYVFGKRFVVQKEFKNRLNKAMAVGTISTVSDAGYEEYEKFMGTPWVQPMRKEIYDNKNSLSDIIDSYISHIHEDTKNVEFKHSDNKIIKIFKILYNIRFGGWRQTKYYSFNMVEKFNEYKMFVCPEEIVGMPGIGFVEGMACGCAYIGLDSDMYKCLGLIPMKHYIAYDGTLADLRSKCEYYMQHEDELEIIAQQGCEFVRQHFNTETAAHSFFEQIINKS